MSFPNVRGIHRWLIKNFHPADYATHKLELIDHPGLLRKYLSERCDLLYFDYWVTWRPFYSLPGALDLVSRGAQKLLKLAHLYNVPNSHFSPLLWSVARKW